MGYDAEPICADFIGAAAQDVRLEAQLVSLAFEQPKGSC
jgi:hypothetical protein